MGRLMRNLKWGGVLALALLVGALYGAAPAQAMGKVKLVKGCGVVGTGVIDPIVHGGEPVGTGHSHEFYGNQAPLTFGNDTTYADMLAATVPCQNVGDTAGYWSPCLLDTTTGKCVPIQQFTAYYRCASGANTNCPDTVEVPADARIVAHVYNWTCGQKSGARSHPSSVIPDCRGLSGKPGLTLTSHITFPSYWDGQLNDHTGSGDTEDSEHFAYPAKGGGAPPGFPIPVTQLKETVQYQYVGDPANLVLSSDAMDGTSQGRSLHGDYWQTWQHQVSGEGTQLQTYINRCVTPVKQAPNCG